MDIFSVITLIGGLTFFLYGMHVMSAGLEKLAGGKLESILKRITSNRLKSLVLGAVITVAIQSSSAVTVMLVGLVGSHIMTLSQSIGIIMGSNIGTTLTAWILSLTGLQSSNIFIGLMRPEYFSALLAFAGIIMVMMSKKKRRRDIGEIFVGFAVLIYGMTLMSNSVSPLASSPSFTRILTLFENPLLGLLVGTVFTGIIQSSAASIGVLQALSLTGNISYGVAIPIILGQNIGTCVTAMLGAIGASKDAKRVAVVHVVMKIIGAAIYLILFYLLDAFIHFSFTNMPIDAVGIAAVHSIFNILNTVALLPFTGWIEKISRMIVRGGDEKRPTPPVVDELLLGTPSVAVAESNAAAMRMCKLATDTARDALSLFEHYDEELANRILQNEDELDFFEDSLSSFLLKLSAKSISDPDNRCISKILHTIGDFERLGDHAVNLLRGAQEMRDKDVHFSEEALDEIKIMFSALYEILSLTCDAYCKNDLKIAGKVEPLEQVIDIVTTTVKSKHVERLRRGECTIELGFILSDLLNNCERIGDHCSNIAVAVIELAHGTFDSHEYLASMKGRSNAAYNAAFDEFEKKYSI